MIDFTVELERVGYQRLLFGPLYYKLVANHILVYDIREDKLTNFFTDGETLFKYNSVFVLEHPTKTFEEQIVEFEAHTKYSWGKIPFNLENLRIE